MGMNCAQETLTSRAFGSGKLALCGNYLNQGRIINTVLFLPLVVLLLFSDRILLKLGQSESVVRYAYQYVTVCLPGVYFQGMFDL